MAVVWSKGCNLFRSGMQGIPAECARAYNEQGADELVFLDITASAEALGNFAGGGQENGRGGFFASDGGRRGEVGRKREGTFASGSGQGESEHGGGGAAGVDCGGGGGVWLPVCGFGGGRAGEGWGEVGGDDPRRAAGDGPGCGGVDRRGGAAWGGGDFTDQYGSGRE